MLAKIIKEQMAFLNMNVPQLAEAAGIPDQTLRNVLKAGGSPGLNTFRAIAKGLSLEASDLMYMVEAEEEAAVPYLREVK